MGIDPKGLVQAALFSRWRRPLPLEDGYSIILASPMDMPFLLRFALEGLRRIETTHCKQILVIPDSWGGDGGKALREIVASWDDPRVELAELRPGIRFFLSMQRRKSLGSAANWSHWAMIVEGTSCSRCKYAFLHDADAFFVEADALERQYRECLDRGMYTLGVEARSDEFFAKLGYTVPGTWEMMYSIPWARSRSPIHLKGRWRPSPHGRHEFDTMLYPQYLDAPTGKIGVMAEPPRLVHFYGAVTTYRILNDHAGQPVIDELFRLLLISILEDLLPAPDGKRILPTPGELARGLTDSTAPITFGSDRAVEEYPNFRKAIDGLCDSPSFAGARADRIRELIRPFDEHFASLATVSGGPSARLPFKTRRHGLG